MKKTTMLAVLAGGLTATAALAQPAFTDLGTLTAGSPLTTATPALAAGQIAWFRFTLPTAVRYQDLRALDAWTFNAGTALDSEIAIYDSVGNLIIFDDDDGNGVNSAASFGTGGGGFPAGTTTLTANNGRDGDLVAAGDYYVAVSHFSAAWGATNWTVTTAPTSGLATVDLTLRYADITPVDPAGTIDLGTLGAAATINSTGNALAAGQVQWFRVNLPGAIRTANTFVDIDTEGSLLSPSNTTRLVMYSPSGTFLGFTDTIDGSGSLSQLTFGDDTPARPAVGTGLAYNGRDAANLRAGVYYIGVAGPGTLPTTSAVSGINFGFASTSTTSGTINLNLNTQPPNTPPTGLGSAVGCVTAADGGNATLRVTVSPGVNPGAAISSVTVDGTALGLASTLTLLDNGLSGDLLAGDNVYGTQVTIASGFVAGTTNLPFTITDAISRTGTGNVPVLVTGTAIAAGTGVETIAGAIVPPGTPGDPLASIAGTFVLNQAAVYQIQICDEAAFSATTLGGTTADTQMFLFNPDGTGVVMNDDHVTPTTGLQSTITSNFVTANGTYYLAVTQYDRDPVVDACGSTIWLDTPFRSERAPDGQIPGGTLFGWTGTAALPATTAYTIALTGTCVPGSTTPACDSVDFNNDGVFPDDQDLADFIFVLGGGDCPTCNDVDFNNDGVFPDDSDLETFLFVLGGGSC